MNHSESGPGLVQNDVNKKSRKKENNTQNRVCEERKNKRLSHIQNVFLNWRANFILLKTE